MEKKLTKDEEADEIIRRLKEGINPYKGYIDGFRITRGDIYSLYPHMITAPTVDYE